MQTLLAFVLAVLVQIAAVLWGTGEARRFLRAHAHVREPQALEAFKTLARRNMLAAIGVLILGAGSLGLALLVVRDLGAVGLATVIALYAPCTLLSIRLTKLEGRTRNLPCEDPSMLAEYQRVGTSWRKKLLPDF